MRWLLHRSVDDKACDPTKRVSGITERLQRRDSGVYEARRARARDVHSRNAGVGRLAARFIGTTSLAQCLGLTFDIKDVIMDLERESDVAAVDFQRFLVPGSKGIHRKER